MGVTFISVMAGLVAPSLDLPAVCPPPPHPPYSPRSGDRAIMAAASQGATPFPPLPFTLRGWNRTLTKHLEIAFKQTPAAGFRLSAA